MSTMSAVLTAVKTTVEAIELTNGSGVERLFGEVMIGLVSDPRQALKERRWPICVISDAGGSRDPANLDIRTRRVRLTVIVEDSRDNLGEWAMLKLLRIDGRLEAELVSSDTESTPLWLVQDSDIEAVFVENGAPLLMKSWVYEVMVDSERT